MNRNRWFPASSLVRAVTVSALVSACATSNPPLPKPEIIEAVAPGQHSVSWSQEFADDLKLVLPVTGLTEPSEGGIQVEALLLVSTNSGSLALDADDGEIKWRRPDLRLKTEDDIAPILGTDKALVTQSDAEQLIELSTGRTLWSSADLEWSHVEGYVPLSRAPVVLVFGEDRGDKPMVGAVRLDDGSVIWTGDQWTEELETSGDAIQKHQHLLQPLFLSDSVVVAWVSKDGPIAFNFLTGALRWKADDLAGVDVPQIGLGPRRASWLSSEGVIYVPYEKRLAAVAAASGEILWDVRLQDAAGKMELLGDRLLVEGWGMIKGSLDMRDVRTGESVWGKATTGLNEPGTYIRLNPGEVHLAADKKLVSITLADGIAVEAGEFDFEAGEKPIIAWAVGERGCFAAEQNIACVASDGAFAYRRYYPEPDKNMLRGLLRLYSFVNLAGAAYQTGTMAQVEMQAGSSMQPWLDQSLDRMYSDLMFDVAFTQLMVQYGMQRMAARVGATNYARDRAVFLTKRPALGDENWTIVEIDVHDGAELKATPLDQKPQGLLVDPAARRVIVQVDGSRLVALRMFEAGGENQP